MPNIFVSNLDYGITSEDLKVTFSVFGSVKFAHVVYDSQTRKSRGFGYVGMENIDNAILAIDSLNGLEVEGRKIKLCMSSRHKDRACNIRKSKKKVVVK